jgi:hypothetical protein
VSGKLSRVGYEKLIAEDIEWLRRETASAKTGHGAYMERYHIEQVLRASIDWYYPPTELRVSTVVDPGPPPKWPCAKCGRPLVPTVRGLAPRHLLERGRRCPGSFVLVDTGRQ